VTFRYREADEHGAKPLQYGLIAEEVAEAFPELVVYNARGEPETVLYQELTPILLNEVQQQRERLHAQEATLAAQARALEALRAEVDGVDLLKAKVAELEQLRNELAGLVARASTPATPATGGGAALR
jgi:hypothetical protein